MKNEGILEQGTKTAKIRRFLISTLDPKSYEEYIGTEIPRGW